jgi:hypothetical protein
LDGFLDRYTFANDPLSPEKRQQATFDAMMEDEKRISTYKPFKSSTRVVLQRARRIAKAILGSYNEEEHFAVCRFGRRASVGNPFSRAYLDVKLAEDPLTGSKGHIDWFAKRYIPSDGLLAEVLLERAAEKQTFTMCDNLSQSFAPKSYNKDRGIVPNTLLGTYYTYGLGVVFSNRLCEHGLDITKLQPIHQMLAEYASRSLKLVTADLKAASQSITSVHVRHILPREWWRVVNLGRIRYINYEGVVFPTETFSGMGNGFTFPLQTLIFYCLLKAIQELLTLRGRISVYGDDLIYPRNIHKYVCSVFEDLNFVLNPKKTYSNLPFRESCGGDFYRGYDVRPVRPEGQNEELGALQFASFLYKVRNNLQRKWDTFELPATFAYIDTYLVRTIGCLHIVPPLFPDTAGIKVLRPTGHTTTLWKHRVLEGLNWHRASGPYTLLPTVHWATPIHEPRYNTEKQHWMFKFIDCKNGYRVSVSDYPYFWERLRDGEDPLVDVKWVAITDIPRTCKGFRYSWKASNGEKRSFFSPYRIKKNKRKGKKEEVVSLTLDRSKATTSERQSAIEEWPITINP